MFQEAVRYPKILTILNLYEESGSGDLGFPGERTPNVIKIEPAEKAYKKS